jgi:hypothetical protein
VGNGQRERGDELMSYRTFFTVRLDGLVVSLDERATYLDIGDQLVVEQVAARLSGTKLGVADMAIAFPDALRAAQVHAFMRRRALVEANLRGPFTLATKDTPVDDELVGWYIINKGTVRTCKYRRG